MSTPVTLVRNQPEEKPAPPPIHDRAVNILMLRSGWDNFLDILKAKRPMLASQLGMVQLREIKENRVLAVFPSSGENSKVIVEKPDNIKFITDLLREHFKANLNLRLEIDHSLKAPAHNEKQNNGSAVDVKKLVENSPRIRMLIEKVNGEVIGVKKPK